MIVINKIVLSCYISLIFVLNICESELLSPSYSLALYSPGELEYTDVLVKQEHETLTLLCELRAESGERITLPKVYVWNYMPNNASSGTSQKPSYTTEPAGSTVSSKLVKEDLQLSDSGHYMCSAPPFSVTKYILVQTKAPKQCAHGAFWCGQRCVLASYVCDGFRDCLLGEDEAPDLCDERPCAREDKLNCTSGRCVPEAACCRAGVPPALCQQPSCCAEHPKYLRAEGYGGDIEYPAMYDDRHAPDDYGFIQSTIYTVTACALIFMIAVVFLVSAICKMHMKRAALRNYAATRNHYNLQFGAQPARFPPCYEASRLLEQEVRVGSVAGSPAHSPRRAPPQLSPQEQPNAEECSAEEVRPTGFGLTRLSAMFNPVYRQVPTQCCDVEMTDVRSVSLNSSPTRSQTHTRLDNYRSPAYCDLNNSDFIFTNPESPNFGRDLNYMATPMEFFRRRTLRNSPLERVIDQFDRQRPLTLQLGRFQFSIPRFGRRHSTEPRPDTPNIAEINIDDLDFVRLNSNETYTLNGRTIRLLGANFENYPVLNNSRPPPYNEAMRYKLCGPPPEYLSRDALNNDRSNATVTGNVDEEARSNVEMPPCYDDLAIASANIASNTTSGNTTNATSVNNNNNTNTTSLNNNSNATTVNNNSNVTTVNSNSNATTVNNNGGNNVVAIVNNNTVTDTELPDNANNTHDNNLVENISSVIDNLPAIDSDVNANETVMDNVKSVVVNSNG